MSETAQQAPDSASGPPASPSTVRSAESRCGSLVGFGVAGLVIGAIELLNLVGGPATPGPTYVLLALGMGIAVTLSRVTPAVALMLMLAVTIARPVLGVDTTMDPVALAIVAYQCGRRGGRGTLVVSGFYVPAAYLLGGFYVVNVGTDAAYELGRSNAVSVPFLVAVQVISAAAPLALPWVAGLAVRLNVRARRDREQQVLAERERAVAVALQAQAEGLAEVRQQQADFAREVHDVVGHSLAVILAQAESAAYLKEPPTGSVREMLDNIAASARASLEDVRRVLVPDPTGEQAPHDRTLDEVLEGFVAGAGPVRSRVIGAPRPLPPDVAVAAQRLLQEMLTNALKHGDRDRGVTVVRDWTRGLRIEVSNRTRASGRGRGMGLRGMSRRAEAVGGILNVEDSGHTFRVEAVLGSGAPPAEGERTAP